MAEYIEKEALLLRIDLHGTNKFGILDEDIREFIKEQPAADVAPVRHGRWILIETDEEQLFFCSECENKEYWESDFCPSCGAKMDGGIY